MEKPALTKFEVYPLIKQRWSPRSFTDKPIATATIQRILEAARWSPSAYNEQPWRFFIGVKGDKTWDKIFDTLVEFNQNWAKRAQVLILTIGSKYFSNNGQPNNVFAYDVGQSAAYITIQAMHEGLRVHQMSGFDHSKAVTTFGIPADFIPLSVIALGYQGSPDLLSDDLKAGETAPRSRKGFDELAFGGQFGNPSPYIG